jgi:competence protein ComEC
LRENGRDSHALSGIARVSTLPTSAALPLPDVDELPRRPVEPAWREFAKAPLVPVALAVTAGLIADRYIGVPFDLGLGLAAAGVLGWFVARKRRPERAVVCLWVSFAGLAAAYHHAHRHLFDANDIGEFTRPAPALVRVRGVLDEDPIARFAPKADPLEPANRPDRDAAVLRVTGVAARDGAWIAASGRARLMVDRETAHANRPALAGLRAGDGIEFVAMLSRPGSPRNPGERDYANYLLDQRIRAELHVSDTSAGITRLDRGDATASGVLALLRRRAAASLADNLPPRETATAAALLLGDGSAMERTEWEAYIRTGVVHALAISGQHLAVLAWFLWFAQRGFTRRSRAAWVVLLVVVGYTVLTGLRPSGVRAAAMATAFCGALILRRPMFAANSFALGWLAVIAHNPTDIFTLGCRLSFLSVFILVWGLSRWARPEPPTPLEYLIDESRPWWVKRLRWLGRYAAISYLITLVVAVVNAPLLIAEQNLISPVGLLIGPPVVLLTSLALLAGFALMLLAPLGPIVWPFALVTRWALMGCEAIVRFADAWPGGSVYVSGVPTWWLVGFYLSVAGLILLAPSWRMRCALGLVVWVFVGVVLPAHRSTDELRVTVLAVGKGGCVVLETPDGRCLIYDAGAASGPGAVRRVIAPYLWQRGIRRVDELFISHADTDHFNGIDALADRFPIGQVTLTPSFAEKPTREVAAALLALKRHRIPSRLAVAGDRFTAGDVEIDVLHPPPTGPPGTENERSLVLLVHHAGHSILLTGDLEKAGTGYLLAQPPNRVDVLMAPHHGSRAALPRQLVRWCEPRIVVVSRGRALGNTIRATDTGPDLPIWDTDALGAITIRSHATGLIAEAYRTGERRVLARGR